MAPTFLDIMGIVPTPYNPPKPSDVPKEIGIELYNLDTADEKAVDAFIWKQMDDDSPYIIDHLMAWQDYEHSLTLYEEGLSRGVRPQPVEADRLNISEFRDILELKPMIERAIKGEEPTSKDSESLNKHLVENVKYVTNDWDPPLGLAKNLTEILPEGKEDRTILREISTSDDGRLRWKIHKWIYYVWSLAIEVKQCKASGCKRILLAGGRQSCGNDDCQKLLKKETDQKQTQKKREETRKRQARLIADWIKSEWALLPRVIKIEQPILYSALDIQSGIKKHMLKDKHTTSLDIEIRRKYKLLEINFGTPHKVSAILHAILDVKDKPNNFEAHGISCEVKKRNNKNHYFFKKITPSFLETIL